MRKMEIAIPPTFIFWDKKPEGRMMVSLSPYRLSLSLFNEDGTEIGEANFDADALRKLAMENIAVSKVDAEEIHLEDAREKELEAAQDWADNGQFGVGA